MHIQYRIISIHLKVINFLYDLHLCVMNKDINKLNVNGYQVLNVDTLYLCHSVYSKTPNRTA